jgi:hypothetical protein
MRAWTSAISSSVITPFVFTYSSKFFTGSFDSM